ncbi:SMP-30/gluconolactonase/LRE family protein [Providencia burhodogranariea]|uniref:Gluconolactonase n=1 Tax=Providencia burhodogranariea DSM 19968 TaxID=1141662 RepID=K8W666_9GAMM|nr:gluconolactonase [Providencia burhodogranariea DSM 19968]
MTFIIEMADSHCYTLGESPIWCEKNQRLFFLDIIEKNLLIYDPITGLTQNRELPYLTSAITLTTDHHKLLLITVNGIYLYDIAKDSLEQKLAEYPDIPCVTRPNEAAISPQGELFFGTMGYLEPEKMGNWYKFCHEKQIVELCGQPVGISNTLCWVNQTLYFADSKLNIIYQSNDQMKTQQIFAHAERGSPDGSTLCVENKLWNARWGASELAIYSLGNQATTQIDYISLPAINPTSCCFGGQDLTTLYITTASLGLTVDDKWQGRVLAIPFAGKGKFMNRFKLSNINGIKGISE